MKSLLNKLSARRLIILGFSLPSALLIFVKYLEWRSVDEYRSSREWATHTRVVLLDLAALHSCVNDAETGQRGYLLTHQESYLHPYNDAVARHGGELDGLRRLTSDNPQQQRNLDRLEPLIKAKFDEMAQTIALERNSNHAGAINLVMSGVGKNTMEQIRAILDGMHNVETALLQQREQAFEDSSRRNSELAGVVMIVGFAFILMIVLLLRRMERMQEMIKICAWSKLIEYQGEWLTIEDYLSRRFNAYISHGMSDVEAKKMMELLEEEKSVK